MLPCQNLDISIYLCYSNTEGCSLPKRKPAHRKCRYSAVWIQRDRGDKKYNLVVTRSHYNQIKNRKDMQGYRPSYPLLLFTPEIAKYLLFEEYTKTDNSIDLLYNVLFVFTKYLHEC